MSRNLNWKKRWEQVEAGWWYANGSDCSIIRERIGWFSYFNLASKGPFKTATQAVRAAERMERKGKE